MIYSNDLIFSYFTQFVYCFLEVFVNVKESLIKKRNKVQLWVISFAQFAGAGVADLPFPKAGGRVGKVGG